MVASVKGRRPESVFSSVERLILASSARCWRVIRRRASSSMISEAAMLLSSPERLCSERRDIPSSIRIGPYKSAHTRKVRGHASDS
jgi:hypothetical protein